MSKEGHPNERAKGKGRGVANVGRSLAGLGQGARTTGDADWRTVEQVWIVACVVEATRLGGMASFSLSRDRGAYKVTIFLDGDRRDIWISGSEDVNARLEEVVHYLASLPSE